MNIIDKEKDIILDSLESIIILSDFINYKSIGLKKQKRKYIKKMKQMKKYIECEKFDMCMKEEWIDKYDDY